MANENKSVEDTLKEFKNLEFLSSIMSHVKNIDGYAQDSLLEEMVQNENLEKLSGTILIMRKEIKQGFADLSFARNDAKPFKSDLSQGPKDIDVEYVNLSDKSLAVMKGFSTAESTDVGEYFIPMVSQGDRLLALTEEIKNQLVKTNTINTELTDLTDAEVYQQKTTYYMTKQAKDIEGIYQLLKGDQVGVGTSSQSMKDIDKNGTEIKGNGIFDKVLSGLGLKPVWEGLKKAFNAVTGTIDKIFSPVTNALKKGFAWIGTKASGIFKKVIGKIADSKIWKKFAGTKIGGGLIKAAGKLGKFLGPLGKLAGKATKFIPGIGQIITVATSLWSFTDGLQNADKIVGKAKDKLSYAEKVGAGLAGMVEDLSFGLLDAKQVYGWIEKASSMVSDTASMIYSTFPSGVKDALTSIKGALFDEKKGIFGSVITGFKKTIDSLMNDGLWEGVKTGFWSIINNVIEIPKRIITPLLDKLFKGGILDKIDMGKDLVGGLMDKMSSFIMNLIEMYITTLSGGLLDTKAVKKGASAAISAVSGWFGMGDDKEEKKAIAATPKIQSANIASVNKIIDAEKTNNLAQKNSLPLKQVAPQVQIPNVIVQSPVQPRTVERRTKAGSDTVLNINSAGGRS